MAAELTFRAMGSDGHLIVVGGPSDLDLAGRGRARIEELERRWSRFLPTSEVSELNRRAGEAVPVSPDTVELVTRAADAWRLSGGAFDPTVLGSVIRAGYDRSFDELGPTPPAGQSPLGLGAADIVVGDGAVRLPPGTGFDPGGIGKGLAADLVTAELRAAGADGVCVNLRGDVRVSGVAPEGGTWTVAVEHPWSSVPITHVGLVEGAVATSTTLRRQWQTGGQRRHHLIDPQTGLPSTTDVTLATVVAGSAWIAEVLAKAVLLAGASHPFDILGGGAEGMVVDERGEISISGGLPAFLGDPPPALIR